MTSVPSDPTSAAPSPPKRPAWFIVTIISGSFTLLYCVGYGAFRVTHHPAPNVLALLSESWLDRVAAVVFKPAMTLDQRLSGIIPMLDPFETEFAAAERGIDYPAMKDHAFAGDEAAIRSMLRLSVAGFLDAAAGEGYNCDVQDLRDKIGVERFQRIVNTEAVNVRAAIVDSLAYGRPDETDP